MPIINMNPGFEEFQGFGQTSFGGGGATNVGDLTRRTAQSNIDASGQIGQLTQMINSINQRAQQTSNAGRIPGGAGLEALSSGNINRALSGQVDPSVLAQLGQQAAERGIMTGSPGGPSSNAAYLRALGLTTMDLMNTGQNWLTAAQGRNPGAPVFDPSRMFLDPAQMGALEMDRARLPRGGGGYSAGGGGGGGFVGAPTTTASHGFNEEDFVAAFGGDIGRINTPAAGNDFTYPNVMDFGQTGGGNAAAPIYNPSTDFEFGSSLGGIGLYDDAFLLP